jgi:hypothetical protein
MVFFYTLLFLIIAGIFGIGWHYPDFLYSTLLLGIIHFYIGKSTRVPYNIRDFPTTPFIKLSYRDFHFWALRHDTRKISSDLYSCNHLHWTEKLSILKYTRKASKHLMEPSRGCWKLGLYFIILYSHIIFPNLFKIWSSQPPHQLKFLRILSGMLLGTFVGEIWGNTYRWNQGQEKKVC